MLFHPYSLERNGIQVAETAHVHFFKMRNISCLHQIRFLDGYTSRRVQIDTFTFKSVS
jgi:hypothetical protein